MLYVVDLILRQIRYFLDLIAIVIGYVFYPSEQRYLPPITDELLLKPATKLADKIKSGKLKSEDLVKAYVARCREVNSQLNAVVDDCYEEALAQARQVDQRVQRELSGEKPSGGERSIHDYPFLGVPFTTKNSIGVKDKTISGGVYARKDAKAEKDAEAIERMKKIGGAIFLAVTNVPELVMWFDSFNRVNGQTNNPYDKSRIPGGSSGGEGALIGAAGSVFGVGSDIGGSIRIPSHYCGIFGHKTTPNVVSPDGIYPDFSESRKKLLSLGPMCRYVCDVRPMLQVLAGDQLSLPEEPLNYSSLNVYYIRNLGDPLATPVDVEILQGLDKVVKHFIDKGTRTLELDTTPDREGSFYDFRNAFFLWNAAMHDPSQPGYLERLTENHRDTINPYWELLKCMFGYNNKFTANLLVLGILEESKLLEIKLDHFKSMVARVKKNLHELLGKNGVLLCPTFPEVALKHNQTLLKTSHTIYTSLWNAMDVAITTVPLGLDRHGMPYSIQVIVSPYNDNLSIQVAEALEKQFGGWVPPCPVHLHGTN